jgi:hypothetical protein
VESDLRVARPQAPARATVIIFRGCSDDDVPPERDRQVHEISMLLSFDRETGVRFVDL